jgi:hypothetical protein
MAIYHLSVKTVSRSAGRSATAAAAYRAGVELVCKSTGVIHDYRRKGGVVSATIFLPKDAPDWAADRTQLWNGAEASEKRKNSTVAREFEVALPSELDAVQREQLAHEFAQELVARHGFAADVAIHEPGHEGDDRNHHAHILVTTRRLDAAGFGAKTRELDEKKSKEVEGWRERWAELTNRALEQAGQGVRVDHRSLEAQGIARLPTVHLGPTATAIERRGGESRIAQDARRQVQEVLAKAHADAAIEQAREAAIQALQEQLQQAYRERENDDGIRANALSLLRSNVDAAGRDLQATRQSWQSTVGAVNASAADLTAGQGHGRANGSNLGRALEGAQRRIAERHHARAVAATQPELSQVGRVVRRIGNGCIAVVVAITEALTLSREERKAKRYAEFEKRLAEGKALRDAARAERAKTAQDAFLEQHKALPWVDAKYAAVGTLVASEGPFAVLHVGRGKHVLHEFPSEEAVKAFGQPQRDRGMGR